MAFEHLVRGLLAGCPDSDVRVAACGGYPSVFKQRDCIHRTIVKTHDLLGYIARKGPANRRIVEAARDQLRAVGRDRESADWAAVPAQLRVNGLQGKKQGACDQAGAQ